MPPTAPRVNDPPAALDRWPKGRHHLFIVAFSRFLYTHVDGPQEGGREEERAATGLCPLTPAKEMGLPALHLSSLTFPSFLLHLLFLLMVGLSSLLRLPSTAWLMFAMSISLPSGTVSHLPTHRPSVGLGTVSSPEEAVGALSLQPPC